TLGGIARRFGADWRELARANGLPDADRIYPGQLLHTSSTPLSARTRSFTGYCEVQPGDTLGSIARRYGASAAGLRAANALDAQAEPAPGRILRVQPD
ncbi:MAG: LysM peptidoglycan-binding domain-containing protein, partial [Candidatus Fimadaptatus sp.]